MGGALTRRNSSSLQDHPPSSPNTPASNNDYSSGEGTIDAVDDFYFCDNNRASRCPGLQNFGNTCYCNSVLQVLFYYGPFRTQCLKHRNDGEAMLAALSELFQQIESHRRGRALPCGGNYWVSPRKFIQRLKQINEMFNGFDHHDAHEFYNFLINDISEQLLSKKRKTPRNDPSDVCNTATSNNTSSNTVFGTSCNSGNGSGSSGVSSNTWIHNLLEGTVVYRTKCLACENVTCKWEPFIELSVEVEQESNLEKCIRKLASKEKLTGKDKYFCDVCSCLQEAERSSSLGTLPPFLAVHLKRFKFDESHRYSRLPNRVEFPLQLTLPCEDNAAQQKRFNLFAVVIHVGLSLSYGHYICCVKHNELWYLFDDQVVTLIQPEALRDFYGSTKDCEGAKCGYLIFYSEIQQSSNPTQISIEPMAMKTRPVTGSPSTGSMSMSSVYTGMHNDRCGEALPVKRDSYQNKADRNVRDVSTSVAANSSNSSVVNTTSSSHTNDDRKRKFRYTKNDSITSEDMSGIAINDCKDQTALNSDKHFGTTHDRSKSNSIEHTVYNGQRMRNHVIPTR